MTEKLSAEVFKMACGLQNLQKRKFYGKLTIVYIGGNIIRIEPLVETILFEDMIPEAL
jgi:hypothetical protein